MSERKPTKEKLEEEQENNVQLKPVEKRSIFSQDFYVEPPEDVIAEDTDNNRKEEFKKVDRTIQDIIPDYFCSFSSRSSKKKKRKLQEQEAELKNTQINNQFIQMQNNKQNDKDEREK